MENSFRLGNRTDVWKSMWPFPNRQLLVSSSQRSPLGALILKEHRDIKLHNESPWSKLILLHIHSRNAILIYQLLISETFSLNISLPMLFLIMPSSKSPFSSYKKLPLFRSIVTYQTRLVLDRRRCIVRWTKTWLRLSHNINNPPKFNGICNRDSFSEIMLVIF